MNRFSSLLVVATLAACSDAFSPTVDNVAGDYAVRTFTTITDTSGTKDWIAAGATFTISLAANGTTTGQLFIPGGDEDGGDFNADMAGTWTLTAGTVEFAQTADTFVRDFPFRADKDRLTVDQTIAGVRFVVVLTK